MAADVTAASAVGAAVAASGGGRSKKVARSLVAFDVDKTVLHQGKEDELALFRHGICRTLIRAAQHGLLLAAITGNSLQQLASRFLKALVEELCTQGVLELLCNFHFFCNGASLYIHIDPQRCQEFASLLAAAGSLGIEELQAQAANCIFDPPGAVRSRFVLSRYAQQCCIPQEDAADIVAVCDEECQRWWNSIAGPDGKCLGMRERFYIAGGDGADATMRQEAASDAVNKEAAVFGPCRAAPAATTRTCVAGDGVRYITSVNVLPVLSFRHARGRVLPSAEDPRMRLVAIIRERMQRMGLVRYIVNPGGRSTIDISHHLVNKRSALVWLLRQLGAEGVEQLGEPLGVNAVYFGDEVILHGNDLAVAEVPGVLVFAVNELRQRVPFRTNVELPTETTALLGPEATQAVLEDLVQFVEVRLQSSEPDGRSVIAAWKERRLMQRLKRKSQQLLGEMPPEPRLKVTYRRREAAAAVLTALTRRGEGLDDFADTVIDLVNNIGMLGAVVREQQFEAVHPQGLCRVDPGLDGQASGR